MTPEELPVSEIDHLALSNEFYELQAMAQKAQELERKQDAGETLTADEVQLLEALPDAMRRAVTITRILRRTNTGPAKAKAPRKSSKKALAQSEIDKLIDL
jgi:hypothetical protein